MTTDRDYFTHIAHWQWTLLNFIHFFCKAECQNPQRHDSWKETDCFAYRFRRVCSYPFVPIHLVRIYIMGEGSCERCYVVWHTRTTEQHRSRDRGPAIHFKACLQGPTSSSKALPATVSKYPQTLAKERTRHTSTTTRTLEAQILMAI